MREITIKVFVGKRFVAYKLDSRIHDLLDIKLLGRTLREAIKRLTE